MDEKWKALLITIIIGAIALPLGYQLWPVATDLGTPTESLMPYFMIVALVESLAFGAAIAWLVLGFKWAKKAAKKSMIHVWALYISIAWQLGSWWIHDHLHQAMHMGDWHFLLYIEYTFHITLIVTGVVVALAILEWWKQK